MSWKELNLPTNEGSSDFLKLQEGDNKLRIASYPHQRFSHFDQKLKKSYPHKTSNCDYCLVHGEPRVRYLFYVIDLKDKKQKLLEVGTQIVKQIKQYAMSEEYAFDAEVSPYYVNIQREGTGLDTQYTVIPARANTDLTEEENKLIAERKPLKEVAEALDGKKDTPKKTPFLDDEIRVEDIPF